MPLITGYTIGQELYASRNSIVYRGHRASDGAPVILKTLREAAPTPERLAWFRREYELTRSLTDVPGVVSALSLEQHPTGWVLVLEDSGGESLANLGLAGRLDLPTFLCFALDLTRILGAVHQQQIIHKDINPANIVYNQGTGQITLIDFGLATRLSRETTTFQSATGLEGTLRYLAPEQTGRMNRVVDYRSDFYSLGITFYELLTGQVPFTSDDLLEIVHSHIARPPTPPHLVQPAIPEPLSAIILKLLAKDADERYQSAYGLQTDLAHCLHALEQTGAIAPFPLARQDISDRFALPQHLYGREEELATLRATFDRVAAEEKALLLVAGAPGIGKTALVQEIYRPLTARRGAFISGKFDQLQRSTPYLAFVQAFRGLVGQLLTEPDPVLQQWRARITEALGVNGQVVVEVIPNLELIIGPQPAVPDLGPQEARNRFLLAFLHFVRVFTRPEHPLVLFLDDLQWADSGSLTLLEQLLGSGSGGSLFVIGSYRDTEVPPGHLLWSTLDAIQQAGTPPQTLTLGPLDDAAVGALVQDTLHVDAATAQPLATLVNQKTGGNPFFLGEFLKALAEEGLLSFDPTQGQWTWNLAQIEARQMTDNVVALMTQQVERLPVATQQALQHAACIGSRFDLATLAASSAQAPTKTAMHLEPALLAGLIEPIGEGYKVVTLTLEGGAAIAVAYRFIHDRVQQAVYEQVPAAERTAQHWRIGRLLLANTPVDQREEQLFDLTGQLNAGRALATAPERLELAHLNLQAGRKAKDSAAFASALVSFQVGLDLLPPNAWQTHYTLTLTLHEEAAETAYLSGDFAEMEHLAEVVLTHARTVLDTVKVCEARIQAGVAQKRFVDAIQMGRAILMRLGIHVPEAPAAADVGQAVHEAQAIFAERSIESLLALPLMTDPASRAALRILMLIASPSYIALPLLHPILVIKVVVLSVTIGNTPHSIFAYMLYGLILNALTGDIDACYRLGILGHDLTEKLKAREIEAKTIHILYLYARPYTAHFRESIKPLQIGFQKGLETGDIEYGSYNLYSSDRLAFFAGTHLGELVPLLADHHHALLSVRQPTILQWQEMLWHMVVKLAEPVDNRVKGQGNLFDADQMAPHLQETHENLSLAYYYVYRLMLSYLFEQTTQVGELAATTEQYLVYTPGDPVSMVTHMYTALVRLRRYPDARTEEQASLLEQATTSQQHLQTWAEHGPMNCLHKWHLVEAERCRVLGEAAAAREHYDQAIAGARTHGYIHEEALAHELAGRFYLARSQTDLAQFYLTNAHRAYATWGATAKVQQLEAQYPTLSAAPPIETQWRSTSNSTTTAALDVASLVKTSQALSSEVQLEALLARLLQVLLETAGADRGALLLPSEGHWRVEAEGHIAEAATVLAGVPLTQARLPQNLLSYALRTGTAVVLDDAPTAGAFTQDPYIQQQQPRSVLALPLIQQGALIGLLYLENTQTSNAFTTQRQEILALLLGQVAISLENARLYTRQEDLVAERTAQLSAALSEAEAARAAAEEANTLKTRFVANMSHELRTPLNSIINFTYILKSGLRGPTTPEQVIYLDRIYASGEHLLGLINDILDMAKIEAGQMDLFTEEVALEEVVKGTLSTAIGLTKDKPIVLHEEVPDGLPPIVADKTRIRQVLLNLLSNAAKFTDAGEITVRVWQAGDELVTSVTDTGMGIPADKLEIIFQEFRQADEGSARSYQGTGLGLPICRRLIEMHGGRLWVESVVGVGSTFFFSLPLEAVPVAP